MLSFRNRRIDVSLGGRLVLCWMKEEKLATDSMEFRKWWTKASEGRLIGEKLAEASEILWKGNEVPGPLMGGRLFD